MLHFFNYICLQWRSFTNLRAIGQGWKNYVFKSETIELLAKERAKICAGCEHFKKDKIFKEQLPDRSIKEIQGIGCNLCGCPLSTKLRQVIQICPHDPPKWE